MEGYFAADDEEKTKLEDITTKQMEDFLDKETFALDTGIAELVDWGLSGRDKLYEATAKIAKHYLAVNQDNKYFVDVTSFNNDMEGILFTKDGDDFIVAGEGFAEKLSLAMDSFDKAKHGNLSDFLGKFKTAYGDRKNFDVKNFLNSYTKSDDTQAKPDTKADTQMTPKEVADIINDETQLSGLTPQDLSKLQSQAHGDELAKINKFIMELGKQIESGELTYEKKEQYEALSECLEKQKEDFDKDSDEMKAIEAVSKQAQKSDVLLDFESKNHKLKKLAKKRYIDTEDLKQLVELNAYFKTITPSEDITADAIEASQEETGKIADRELDDFVKSELDCTIDDVDAKRDLIAIAADKELQDKATQKLDTFIKKFDEENGIDIKDAEALKQYDNNLRVAGDYFENLNPFATNDKKSQIPEHKVKLAEAESSNIVFYPDGKEKSGIKKWDDLSWSELADVNINVSPKDAFDNSKNGITKEREAFQEYLWKKLQKLDKQDISKDDLAAIQEILKTPYIKNKSNEEATKKDKKAFEKIEKIFDNAAEKLLPPNLQHPEFAESYKLLNAIEFTQKQDLALFDRNVAVNKEKSDNYQRLVAEAAKLDAMHKYASLTPEQIKEYAAHAPDKANLESYIKDSLLNQSITEITTELVLAQDVNNVLKGNGLAPEELADTLRKMAETNKTFEISEDTLTSVLAARSIKYDNISTRFSQLSKQHGYELKNSNFAGKIGAFDRMASSSLMRYTDIKASTKEVNKLNNSSYGRNLLKTGLGLAKVVAAQNIPGVATALGVQVMWKSLTPLYKDWKMLRQTGQWNGWGNYIKNNKGKFVESLWGATLGATTIATSLIPGGSMLTTALKTAGSLGLKIYSDGRRNGWSFKNVMKSIAGYGANMALYGTVADVASPDNLADWMSDSSSPTDETVTDNKVAETENNKSEEVKSGEVKTGDGNTDKPEAKVEDKVKEEPAKEVKNEVKNEKPNEVSKETVEKTVVNDDNSNEGNDENNKPVDEKTGKSNEGEVKEGSDKVNEGDDKSLQKGIVDESKMTLDEKIANEEKLISQHDTVKQEVNGVKYTFTIREDLKYDIAFDGSNANLTEEELTALNKAVAEQVYGISEGGPLSEEQLTKLNEKKEFIEFSYSRLAEFQEEKYIAEHGLADMESAEYSDGYDDEYTIDTEVDFGDNPAGDGDGSSEGSGTEASKQQETDIKTDQELQNKNLDNADKDRTVVAEEKMEDRKEVDKEFERNEKEQKAHEDQTKVNTEEGKKEDIKTANIARLVAQEEAIDRISDVRNHTDLSNYASLPSEITSDSNSSDIPTSEIKTEIENAAELQDRLIKDADVATDVLISQQSYDGKTKNKDDAKQGDELDDTKDKDEQKKSVFGKIKNIFKKKDKEDDKPDDMADKKFNYNGKEGVTYEPDDSKVKKAQKFVKEQKEKGVSLQDYSLQDFAKIMNDAFNDKQTGGDFKKELLREAMRRADEFSYDKGTKLASADVKAVSAVLKQTRENIGMINDGKTNVREATLTAAESMLKSKGGDVKLDNKEKVFQKLKEGQEDGKTLSVAELHEFYSIAKSKKLPKKLHSAIQKAFENTVSSDKFECPKTEKELQMLEDLNLAYGTENGRGNIDNLRGVDVKYTEVGQEVSNKINETRDSFKPKGNSKTLVDSKTAQQAAFARNNAKGM